MKTKHLLLLGTLISLCAFRVQIKNKKVEIIPNRAPASATPAPAPTPAGVPAGGTCDAHSSVGLCYLFTGPKNAEEKPLKGNQMACRLFRGQYSQGDRCPASSRLGKCTVLGGTPDEYTLIYYPGKFDAAKAQADCANPKSGIHRHGAGTWQPG